MPNAIYTGLVLVTDAVSALGLQPGIYQLGYQDVDVKKDCAVLVGTNTLAGAIATLDRCIRHFKKVTGEVLASEHLELVPVK